MQVKCIRTFHEMADLYAFIEFDKMIFDIYLPIEFEHANDYV